MKAAVLLCTYEKNECLPNTLVGLSRQRTSFPWKTVLLDDGSPEDPSEIIAKYLPSVEYHRLEERLGGRLTRTKYFDYLEDDIDTLLFLSADVVMLQDNIVQELCTRVDTNKITMGQVKDHWVLPQSHQTFDFFCQQMLDMWDLLPGNSKVYSGSTRPDGRWFFFMGAIRKDDALKIGMHETGCCDAIIDKQLRENNFSPIFCDDLKGLHQHHQWIQHPCASLNTCKYETEFMCRSRGIVQG